MKLNPPETAPKDDFILGVFNQEKRMCLEWTEKLTGWLPLPKIDGKGNAR